MSRTNDAVVFTGEEQVALEERPVPEPGADEVLIETERSLISAGTELTMLSGEFPEGSVWDDITDYPFPPGYCNVGRVVEVGADVPAERVAERVATWNPHARYVTEAAEDCIPVPDGVPADAAPLFSIAAIVANGLRRSRLEFGEAVAVYGLGVLGQLAVRLAAFAGARATVGIDLADERLAYLPDEPGVIGANPTEEGWFEAVEDATDGRLADVVFEVTGNPDAITGEFAALRERGRLVMLSSPRGETPFDFHDYCNRHSYEIVGAHVSSHPDHEEPDRQWTLARNAALYFRLVAEGRLDASPLVSHVESPADAPAAYEMLLEDRTRAMAVEFDW